MKLTKILAWAGRVLGISMLAACLAAIIYAVVMIKSETEQNIGFIFLIIVSVLLFVFLGIFLLVAWRREIMGGMLYLVFALILELLVLTMDLTTQRPISYANLYLIGAPIGLTGLLFLISARLKKTPAIK